MAALNAAIAEQAAQDKTPTSDIQQAVADGATVPIDDESRLAQLDLAEGEKHILRKHGYPPDLQALATQTVIEQAKTLSEGWAVA